MSSKRGRVNQYERHVGSHHRVYGLTSPDGYEKIVYSIGWIERCRLDSFIEIHLRDGNSFHDVNLGKSGKSLAAVAATRLDGSIDPIRRVWVFHPTVFFVNN